MKEFIDKLIERLEEEKAKGIYDIDNVINVKDSYGKAIKIVNELAEEYNKKYEPTMDLIEYGVDGYNLHLKEQYKKGYEDAKKENAWIPCSERLPELTEGTECFKQSKCCLVALKWWDGDITESVAWYNQSGVWNEDSKNCKVIAWQPLPAPYTEGEAELYRAKSVDGEYQEYKGDWK